jgi:hypothetical protein
MNQKLQKIEEIEGKHQYLVQKLDSGTMTHEEFKREVGKLSHLQVGGKEWRISPAGQWVYREGNTWIPGDIRQFVEEPSPTAASSTTGETLPSTTRPALPRRAEPAGASVPATDATQPPPLKLILITAGGAFLLLLVILALGTIFTSFRGRGRPTPFVIAATFSPTTKLASPVIPSPTSTPVLSTPTLSPVPLPLTPTPTVSPSTTPTPSPSPMPTEILPHTATPTSTQIPPSPSPSSPPTPALQGKIAYADYDMASETYHIYLLDLSNPTPVKLIEDAAEPSFSPDGKQIAYRSYAPDRRGLWVQNLDGSGRWQLSYGHESARPQWSPDGRGLIYASCQAGDRHWRLYYPIDEVIEIPGQGWAADWLSAGKLIFAGAVDGQPQPGLYLANVDGSGATSFTLDRPGTAPAVSFDGRYLAYTSKGDSDDNWDVYVANADGTSIRRLTTHPARDGIPTWSPDGAYVAFASDRDGGWGIWVIDADGQGQPRPLVSLGYGLDLHPRDATPDEQHDWTLHTLTWSQ